MPRMPLPSQPSHLWPRLDRFRLQPSRLPGLTRILAVTIYRFSIGNLCKRIERTCGISISRINLHGMPAAVNEPNLTLSAEEDLSRAHIVLPSLAKVSPVNDAVNRVVT